MVAALAKAAFGSFSNLQSYCNECIRGRKLDDHKRALCQDKGRRVRGEVAQIHSTAIMTDTGPSGTNGKEGEDGTCCNTPQQVGAKRKSAY